MDLYCISANQESHQMNLNGIHCRLGGWRLVESLQIADSYLCGGLYGKQIIFYHFLFVLFVDLKNLCKSIMSNFAKHALKSTLAEKRLSKLL